MSQPPVPPDAFVPPKKGHAFAPLVVGLLIPLVLLLNESTRWWGVGILIGYFLTLIVLGGACVALIASFSG